MLIKLEDAPLPEPERLLSVRSGKIKALGNAGIQSGIDKQPIQGPVQVTDVGIPGDEIQYHEHGGIEKALLHYSAGHYPHWRREKPDKKHLFKIGAFGENISSENWNEENVCIGDIYSIGEEVVVQIAEPRLPCFKLNTRFEWPQAARRVQKLNRYGWYLRVLQTGSIRQGDTIQLVKRPNPRWSVKNTMRVLLDEKIDNSQVSEMKDIEGLGKYIQNMAQLRLNGQPKNPLPRTKGEAFDWYAYKVEDAQLITSRIRQLTLAKAVPKTKINIDRHAYVRLRFGSDKPFERSYSVVSGNPEKFVLGISLDDNSRGGSAFLHKDLKIGDKVDVSPGVIGAGVSPPEDFDLSMIKRHIFIIGGIGVTAFLREIESFCLGNVPVEVHYACRSMQEAAYREKLPDDRTTYYAKDQGKRLNVQDLIPTPNSRGLLDSMIYACGPKSLLDEVEARCEELEYPQHLLNMESFGTPSTGPLGDPFEVIVEDLESERKASMAVPAEQSLLDTLNNAGFEVPYSCKAGRCGICIVNVRCGNIQHKGIALSEEAKATAMLSCVSRGKGRIEIEIE